MKNDSSNFNSGSHWLRWDPHIHAPGTVMNDQFKGDWGAYIKSLEEAVPTVRAIGVTDYYSLEAYEKVIAEKAKGRLPDVGLIFPNIEMRLSIGTVKGRWVNIHLLGCPDDPMHVEELNRLLSRLRFKAFDDSFSCSRDDLIRLGKRANSALTDDKAALSHGSEQFKVALDDLKSMFDDSAWARDNVIVAVAGSEADGASGVRKGADAILRQEIEKFADVIFASSTAQREFWLGKRGLSVEQICERYRSLKPCMHGSDAHDGQKVAAPDGQRYTWIKGIPAFDTLRQACIDPGDRAYVGEEPPISALPSQVVASVELKNAPWALTPKIEFNPGLVAIIGARGSGKTALADVIALGCDATAGRLSQSSFLKRARELVGDATVTLEWQEGDPEVRALDGSNDWSSAEYPRARYLSQKFVEDLCSASGMTDELLQEIERVVFEAHSISDRDGAVDFNELRDARVTHIRERREREEEALADISERIGTEIEKAKLVDGLKKGIAEKKKLVAQYHADRTKLVAKGSEERIKRLADLNEAAETVRGYIRAFANREQSLLSVQGEVSSMKTFGAPETLRKMSERNKASALTAAQWEDFLLRYSGDVDKLISDHLGMARASAKGWKGTAPSLGADANTALIPDDAELARQPLAVLDAEIARLEKLISVDRVTTDKFRAVSKRISEENAALGRLIERLEDCSGANDRRDELVTEREAAYQRVFEAITAEEEVLRDLYSPLMERLEEGTGTIKKLAFSVTRSVDVEAWAQAGEDLLDLRRQGTFKGRGTLRQLADGALKEAWETGTPQQVTEAMAKFRKENQEALLERAPVPKSEQANYREWAKRFAKWLYGTHHIRIQYSVDYEGTDIRKLSPGTRGIVLLLLYLALDNADDRPLIIDQPEENLDPKSIFDELVGLFLQAKQKRQVIMVTHNPNLVVNTDADQVIVAQSGPHMPGELPPIRYLSGGLESAEIREAVCNILEGGERAFQERARRLRVSLELRER